MGIFDEQSFHDLTAFTLIAGLLYLPNKLYIATLHDCDYLIF